MRAGDPSLSNWCLLSLLTWSFVFVHGTIRLRLSMVPIQLLMVLYYSPSGPRRKRWMNQRMERYIFPLRKNVKYMSRPSETHMTLLLKSVFGFFCNISTTKTHRWIQVIDGPSALKIPSPSLGIRMTPQCHRGRWEMETKRNVGAWFFTLEKNNVHSKNLDQFWTQLRVLYGTMANYGTIKSK